MKRFWFLAPLAIAILAWAWVGIASFVFLDYIDKLGRLAFPFNQVVIATFELISRGIHNLEGLHTAAGLLIGYGAATLLAVFVGSLAVRFIGRGERQPALYGKVGFADRNAMSKSGLKTSRRPIGGK